MEEHMIGQTFIDGTIIAYLLRTLPDLLLSGAILISGAAIIGLIVHLMKYISTR
jgi:hypothetical protein